MPQKTVFQKTVIRGLIRAETGPSLSCIISGLITPCSVISNRFTYLILPAHVQRLVKRFNPEYLSPGSRSPLVINHLRGDLIIPYQMVGMDNLQPGIFCLFIPVNVPFKPDRAGSGDKSRKQVFKGVLI